MHKQDYYHILGLNQNAAEQDIKTAFMKLGFQYHPEINIGKGNKAKFKEIYEAYAVLRDEAKRREYDRLGLDAFTQAYGEDETSLDFNLESILYEILGVAKDASEQDIDKATSKLISQYRSILKDFGYHSILDISKDDIEKFKKLYKAHTMLKQKAKRRECERPDQDASGQICAGDETSFDFSLEDILYGVKEFARKFGLDFDEKSVDPLGVLPLGKQVANDAYWHAHHLLTDVLGIRIKGKTRGKRLF